PVMGGEDFAYYLEKVPGTFIFISTQLAIEGTCYPHHNSRFAIDEQYLDRSIKIFVQSALDLLG
ncbi:MAG TPA: amidohydrolase, partial [Sedimentibacter sp.]|nr:amidohydrolase [Sedimentibacter sp.]